MRTLKTANSVASLATTLGTIVFVGSARDAEYRYPAELVFPDLTTPIVEMLSEYGCQGAEIANRSFFSDYLANQIEDRLGELRQPLDPIPANPE